MKNLNLRSGLVVFLFSSLLVGSMTDFGNPLDGAAIWEADDHDNQWLRGSGQTLEIRLRGKIVGSNDQLTDPPKMQVLVTYNDEKQNVPVSIEGDEYEVWLPVGARRWYFIAVHVSDSSGDAAARGISRPELRGLAVQGLDFELKPPQETTIQVVHDKKPVAGATVRATLQNGSDLRTTTGQDGKAYVGLPEGALFRGVTVWTKDMLGGSSAIDNSENSVHTIELFKCEQKKVKVIDDDEKPISGATLALHLATKPDYNYLGFPDNSRITTDENGEAVYRWYPEIHNLHCYGGFDGDEFAAVETNVEPTTVSIKARKRSRKTITGSIAIDKDDSAKEQLGGFSLQLLSFQDVLDSGTDLVYATTDKDGNFSAEVLPDSTYSIWVEDKRWKSAPLSLIPYQTSTKKINEPNLVLAQGLPVSVRIMSAKDNKPISGVKVSGQSKHRFSWRENGREQSGTSGSRTSQTSDKDGRVTFIAALGTFAVSARLENWGANETIEVSEGGPNEINLIRNDTTIKVAGQLVLLKKGAEIVLPEVEIEIRAIDGTSGDKFNLQADDSGKFEFETTAKTLGLIAYSADKKFAGTAIIKELQNQIEVSLFPTSSHVGQILDDDGQPVAGHKVWAWVEMVDTQKLGTAHPTTWNKRIETVTDSLGNYLIDGLPLNTTVVIGTETVDQVANQFESVDEVYLLPDEPPKPTKITRLRPIKKASPVPTPIGEQYASKSIDSRLSGYHLMAIIYDASEKSTEMFVGQNLKSCGNNKLISKFLQLSIDTSSVDAPENKDFLKKKDWPRVSAGEVFLCVYDLKGNEIARKMISVEGEAAQIVRDFVASNAPAEVDAKVSWSDAFALATKSDRQVWIRTSGRYCRPCFSLTRWLDENRAVLEKDFVFTKIDVGNDEHGKEIADRLEKDRLVGIPFFAFYDCNEKLICDSYGPTGNIGCVSGAQGKRHFRKMLEGACRNVTPAEIDELLATLDD